MPRGQEKQITGGQIDPYVQQSLQRGRREAENRLLTAMRERGATERTAMTERGATERAGIQAATARAGMAAQAAQDDKRAAEAERARREDLEYRQVNDEANRALEKAIADQNIALRKAEVAQDMEMAERSIALQLDLATIDAAFRAKQAEADRNMYHSMFKVATNQEEMKEKSITNYINAKNETDQIKNVHSLTVENVGARLRDDPKMRLDPTERAGAVDPFGAIQNQLAMEQSKIQIEDLRPENTHRLIKQLSEGDLTFMDFRKAWGVIDGTLSVLDEKVKEADESGNEELVKYWKWSRLRLNNIKVGFQELMNDRTSVTAQENVTVGSIVRDALGPLLDFNTGSQVNKLLAAGLDYESMFNAFSQGQDPYAPLSVIGLTTKEGQQHLDRLNNLITNRGQ